MIVQKFTAYKSPLSDASREVQKQTDIYAVWALLAAIAVLHNINALILEVWSAKAELVPAWTHLVGGMLHVGMFEHLRKHQRDAGPFVLHVDASGIRMYVHAISVLRLYSRFPVVVAGWGDVTLDEAPAAPLEADEMVRIHLRDLRSGAVRQLYVQPQSVLDIERIKVCFGRNSAPS
jgi:hypothetical protein